MTTARIRERRDTSANWASENPVLAMGEHGLDTTLGLEKIGDGVTAWLDLDWTYQALLDDLIDDYVPGTELANTETSLTVATTNITYSAFLIPGLDFTLVGKGRPVELWFYAGNVYHSVANTLVNLAIIETTDGILGNKTQAGGARSIVNTSGLPAAIRRRVFLNDAVSYHFGVLLWGAAAGTSTLEAATFSPTQFGAIAR